MNNSVSGYVGLELAKFLKKNEYDGECSGLYDMSRNRFELIPTQIIESKMDLFKYYYRPDNNEVILAPTLYQVQKWFREKHNIHITPDLVINSNLESNLSELYTGKYMFTIHDISKNGYYSSCQDDYEFDDYESALESGIEIAIINHID